MELGANGITSNSIIPLWTPRIRKRLGQTHIKGPSAHKWHKEGSHCKKRLGRSEIAKKGAWSFPV